VFNLELGQGIGGTTDSYQFNTRGFAIKGNITKQVSFFTDFYENQAFLPAYIAKYAAISEVIPGQARFKPFKVTGYDYAYASGFVSYTPCSFFSVQFGHGKHFVGEGYRSLFLSDNSVNYPFLRINNSFLDGKFKLTNIYASLQNLDRVDLQGTPEGLFLRKGGSFHTLTYRPHKQIELSWFEGLVWDQGNSDRLSALPIGFYNPLIGLNTAFQNKNKQSLVTGFNLKAIYNTMKFYGQLGYSKGVMFQAGIKYFDVAGIKGLDIRLEYNKLGDLDYKHTLDRISYSNYNQPLAHTLGAGVTEFLMRINYKYKRIYASVNANYSVRKLDSTGYSNDLFIQSNNWSWNEERAVVTYVDSKIGFVVNPATYMALEIGSIYRSVKAETFSETNQYIYIRFKTNISNQYYDF